MILIFILLLLFNFSVDLLPFHLVMALPLLHVSFLGSLEISQSLLIKIMLLLGLFLREHLVPKFFGSFSLSLSEGNLLVCVLLVKDTSHERLFFLVCLLHVKHELTSQVCLINGDLIKLLLVVVVIDLSFVLYLLKKLLVSSELEFDGFKLVQFLVGVLLQQELHVSIFFDELFGKQIGVALLLIVSQLLVEEVHKSLSTFISLILIALRSRVSLLLILLDCLFKHLLQHFFRSFLLHLVLLLDNLDFLFDSGLLNLLIFLLATTVLELLSAGLHLLFFHLSLSFRCRSR